MEPVIQLVNDLKDSPIKETIQKRMEEFEKTGKSNKECFREMCFCILTAGTSAELGIKTIEHLGDIIFTETEKQIQKKLKEVYRFHTLRANYIFNARKNFPKLNFSHPDIRDEIVKSIKGLGMKESSHFLRNIGYKDFAIIDFHIIDFLVKNKLIERPKTLNKNKYLEIENILKKLAEKTDTNLGELDLYLWYHETGKVLK